MVRVTVIIMMIMIIHTRESIHTYTLVTLSITKFQMSRDPEV